MKCSIYVHSKAGAPGPRPEQSQPGASPPISRDGAWSVGVHEIHDHAHGSLISAAGVNHGMVNRAIRPFHVEIFLNEVRALTIYGIDQLLGFFLCFSASH